MTYNFTGRAKKAIEIANEVAIELGHNYIGTEHLLISILREGDSIATRILLELNVNIPKLYNEIVKMFNINKIEATNDTVITNVRHKNQIDKAVKSINEAINVAKEKQTEDILAIYIKQTLEDLGEITGDNVSEDIINEIFSKFCLGK